MRIACVKISDVTINEPDTIEAFFANTVSTGSDGAIDMTAIGGTLPYTFYWKDVDSTEDRTNLAVGHYRVTITDSLDCKLKINTSVFPAGICLDTVMQAEEGDYQNLSYHIWYPNNLLQVVDIFIFQMIVQVLQIILLIL